MVMLFIVVVCLMASVSMAGTIGVRHGHTCGTENLSPETRKLRARQQNDQSDNGQEIELGAVFHFCCASPTDCPTEEVAKNEINIMNEHYAPAKIRLNLKNTTQINDASCSQTNVTDANTMDNFKAQSHTGGTDTINIVYVPTNEGPGTNGVCIIPPPEDDIAQSVGDMDGCVVATSTLPGQAKDGGSDSHDFTSVHEAGHWLSLEHTTQSGDGGYGSRRRQSGQTRNIMEPVQITGQGINYQFDQTQITQLRQTALRCKSQGKGGGSGTSNGPGGHGGNNEPAVSNNPGGNDGPGGNDQPAFPSNPEGNDGPECGGPGGFNGPDEAGVPAQTTGPGAFDALGDRADGSRGRVNSSERITGSSSISGKRAFNSSMKVVAGQATDLVHIARR